MPTTTMKDRFATGSAEWVANQVLIRLREDGMWAWVRDIFPDSIVIESDTGALFSIPYSVNGDEITLGEPKEAAVEYILKRMPRVALTGPIVKQEGDQRIVTAPVLVPDEPDSDGDVVTADQIERVAHLWMEKYQNLDFMHTLNNIAEPIESYIAPTDLDFPGGMVPKGSWVLSARVPEELWEDVKKGGLQGFSLMAVQGDPTAMAIKSEADLDAVSKRITLSDLGDDWIVPFVSIVDQPAVPKAKWVAMKRAEEGRPDDPDEPNPRLIYGNKTNDDEATSFVDKLRALFTSDETPSAEKEGRRFSNATYNQLKKAVEALSALLDEAEKERKANEKSEDDMTPDEVQKMIDASVGKTLDGVRESIDEFKKLVAESPVVDLTEDEDEEAEADADGDAEEVTKSEREIELEEELSGVRKEFDDFKAEVEKILPKATSKSLVGQDGDEPEGEAGVSEEYTDSFGNRYRRDALGRAHQISG